MGAGSYAAGLGPAGYDPVAAPSTRTADAVAIPLYDPKIKGYPYAPEGDDGLCQLVDVHPVMQEVSLALGLGKGTIKSLPGLGINIKRIRNTRSADIPEVVRDEVNRALESLIAAKDILLREVRSEAKNGRVGFEADVVNLRDPRSERPVTTLRGSI